MALLLACNTKEKEILKLEKIDSTLDSIFIVQKREVDHRKNHKNKYVNRYSFAPHFNPDSKLKAQLEEIRNELKSISILKYDDNRLYKTVEKKYISAAAIMEFLYVFRSDKEGDIDTLPSGTKATLIDTNFYKMYYHAFDLLADPFPNSIKQEPKAETVKAIAVSDYIFDGWWNSDTLVSREGELPKEIYEKYKELEIRWKKK